MPRGGTILVVEDNAAVRRVAVWGLKSLGYEVREAEDGRAALDILRTSQAVDLLFTDVMMPNGMSGMELCAEARRTRPALKVLFTSGYSEHSMEARIELDRDTMFLGKPYRKDALAAAVLKPIDGGA